ncbi:ATP-dependent DNA ligase [Arthrobacter sp. PsM3]|uniref:ATP-dependent DNA ligase n=1 Tax=Arthrobacter sp. PsM3 TaxID=3030531 RepID=UPI00263AE208|nr:ATP-dependent DNA ligase [Arthrobacter sp. PsM3]MDN4646171.1 ATP-dependent DNA ligase [Arthrobacter sp. PsM3]
MSEVLPAALRAPSLVLTKPVARVPGPAVLPGGRIYEPKWDGFRASVTVVDAGVTFWSRQGKDLTRYFPDVAAAAREHIPAGCVIDGEALVWTGHRLDFNALQTRLTTARRALPALAREHPPSFAAFDFLSAAGHDTRALALKDRRALLEELAAGWAPPLNLSPATSDYATALEWFEDFPPTGIEGLVIKGADQPYEVGVRQWLKVKYRENIDVVCAAVIGRRDSPYALVVGLPMFGRLWIVGSTTALRRSASRHARAHPRPDHPWPEEISPTVIDGFTSRKDPIRLTRV